MIRCCDIHAQTLIPNAGFENWQDFDTLKKGHESPSKWKNYKTDTMFLNNQSGMVRKNAYAARGSFCAEMIVDTSNHLYDFETLENAFPFKGKPNSLHFFSKFSQPGNSASVAVNLYIIDSNGNWQTVGNGFATFGYEPNGWVEQALTIYYHDTTMPTRCRINFDYPSNAVPQKGISFYLDELSFGTKTGVYNISPKQANISRLADQSINLSLPQPATIYLFNPQGQIVYSRTFAEADLNIPTDFLPQGLYYIYINTKNGENYSDRVLVMHP